MKVSISLLRMARLPACASAWLPFLKLWMGFCSSRFTRHSEHSASLGSFCGEETVWIRLKNKIRL